MRSLLYSICLTGLLTVANAGVLTQLDPHKQADVSGQTVELSTLHFDSVPQSVRTMPVAPVSGQTVDRSQSVTTKNVEFNTLDFPGIPSQTRPMANFTAKRATLDQPLIETGNKSTGNAKINPRIIRPFTPAGHQELKDQINKIP